jgi:hypothetical protein
MSANIVNQVAFLPLARNFPAEIKQFTVEVNKSYVEIAGAVNARTIGVFSTVSPAIDGEEWFINANSRQQGLRQVYTFTTLAAINHNIRNITPSQFTRCWGQYNDGANAYGLIWGSNTAIAGQISFYVTTTQIIFPTPAGAPSVTSGLVVLEWISQP